MFCSENGLTMIYIHLLVHVFLELFGCTVDFNSILITNLNEVLYEVSARFYWDFILCSAFLSGTFVV